MTSATKTFREGDPVIHEQTGRLLGHLTRDFVLEGPLFHRCISIGDMPPVFRRLTSVESLATPVRTNGWLRPAFYSEDVRVLHLSLPTVEAVKDFDRSGIYTPVGQTSDHELVKVGDAAKIVLEHFATKRNLDATLTHTRDWLRYLHERGEALKRERNQL